MCTISCKHCKSSWLKCHLSSWFLSLSIWNRFFIGFPDGGRNFLQLKVKSCSSAQKMTCCIWSVWTKTEKYVFTLQFWTFEPFIQVDVTFFKLRLTTFHFKCIDKFLRSSVTKRRSSSSPQIWFSPGIPISVEASKPQQPTLFFW